jgi:hypothetical protein
MEGLRAVTSFQAAQIMSAPVAVAFKAPGNFVVN